MPHRVLYIFPVSRAISEYHAGKNPSLLLRTIRRAIFSHLRTNQSAARQVRDPSMQTSDNLKDPSLVGKLRGVQFPSSILSTCREPILPYVVERYHEEKRLCAVSLGILVFSQARTVQIGQLLLVTFSINHLLRF